MAASKSAPHRSWGRRPKGRAPTETGPRATLEDVRRLIGVDPKPVAAALPEAIARATEQHPVAMSASLEPTITRAIRTFATRESEWFGEILAPTIGASVRKAVADALAALLQRFNEALERSISVQSLSWRWEARKTGRPFAEVVLLRTLVYRVEQVFLIHAGAGLVLQHLVAEGAPSADPDQVASMLSAIESFGREAFEAEPAGTYLHEFALGDLTVWIDRAGPVALAVVVRGRAPRGLLDLVVETRERILLDFRTHLSEFAADITPFGATRPLLEQCLREQRNRPRNRGPLVLAAALVVIAAVAALLVARRRAEDARLSTYKTALQGTPGIVVVSASRTGDHYRISGLRDPLAPRPSEILARFGGPTPELAFAPFYSLDPPLVEERFRRTTRAPPTVSVHIEHGALELSGSAPHAWIERASQLAPDIGGIERIENRVTDSTRQEWTSRATALQSLAIPFETGASAVAPASIPTIDTAVAHIERIEALSAELGVASCIVVRGDADALGTPARNNLLARMRAQAVFDAIRTRNAGAASRVEVQARESTDRGLHFRVAGFEVRTDASGAECHGGTPRD